MRATTVLSRPASPSVLVRPVQPNRIGKQAAMVWLDPDTKARLKATAGGADLSLQELMREAVLDVIRKYNLA